MGNRIHILLGLSAFLSVGQLIGAPVEAPSGSNARANYIEQWHHEAVRQMAIHRIPASITLAQGLLESGSGNSELARKSNNHFGIKCHASWNGARTYHDDDKKGECFRVYEHPGASYHDHSLFLKRNRYAALFDLKITDYKGWARGLKKCGYATNPSYAKLLIELIEAHDLDSFDKEGLTWLKKGRVPDSNLNSGWGSDDVSEEKDDDKDDDKDQGEDQGKDPGTAAQTKEETLQEEVAQSVSAAGLVLGTRDWGLSENDVVWVRAGAGDSFKSLARALDIMAWQLRKYNDLTRDAILEPGQRVYVQPKRRRGAQLWHVVEGDETLRTISQQHGVKIDALEKRYGKGRDDRLQVGERVPLRFAPNEKGKMPWWTRVL